MTLKGLDVILVLRPHPRPLGFGIMIAANPFLQTILEQPDADAPRLVFADWLEERGDPHGELIRLQCEFPHLTEREPRWVRLLERESELLQQLYAHWLQPVSDLGFSARFRRGFLEVTISGVRTFLENADRLFSYPWVLHAHVRDGSADIDDLAELAATPHLARLQRLELSKCRIGNDGVKKLAESPFRCRLTHLALNGIQLSSSGLRTLVQRLDLSRLAEFRLEGNDIGAVGASALAQSPRLAKLRVLDLSYNELGTVGGEYLSESHYLGQLQLLFVRGNSIGNRGRKALRQRFGPRVRFTWAEM